MGLFGETIASFFSNVKRGGVFGKKYTVSALLYKHDMRGEAFCLVSGKLNPQSFDIPYDKIISVGQEIIEERSCVVVEYKHKVLSYSSLYSTSKIVFWGLEESEELDRTIRILWQERMAEIAAEAEHKQQMRDKEEELDRQRETAALTFYQNCFDFHVKADTPIYVFHSGKHAIVALYITEDKSMNFMQIDGYREEENVGIIPYNKLHYYEKAGNVSYATEIRGSHSHYGGSFTGASFSKGMAALGGLFCGYMGMIAGALYSYQPARMTPNQTSFSLDSDIVKIDDRNIILNFYSDEKKQYVDIELPQDIYNFLQTHLPEKKYGIVEEIERQAAVRRNLDTLEAGDGLRLATADSRASDTEKSADDPMAAFKLKVDKLKLMKDAGLLSDEEFDEERKKLLAQL